MSGEAPRFRSSAASHPGPLRSLNEDRLLDRPDLGLWAVADGAGGHQGGDIAASTLIRTLHDLPPDLGPAAALIEIRRRVGVAHAALRHIAAARGSDAMIATTLVLLLAQEGHFACLWAGDSRAYLIREGRLLRLTHDHSAVQELIDAGLIEAEGASAHPQANVITRAIGAAEDPPELDKVSDVLVCGDRFLLCSDGLSKVLPHDQMIALLTGRETAPATRLVAAALAAGATDNISALVMEYI